MVSFLQIFRLGSVGRPRTAMPPADCFAIRPLVGDTEIDEPPREATANPDFSAVRPYGETGEICTDATRARGAITI